MFRRFVGCASAFDCAMSRFRSVDEMIFAALHVLFANQGAPLSVKSRVISNRRFKWNML